MSTLIDSSLSLAVRPLSGAIGAVVDGLDLSAPLGDELVGAVRAALLAHRVLFFPAQHLSPEAHVAFARQFGELTAGHPVIGGIDGHPEVFEIDYSESRRLYASYGDVTTRPGGNAVDWHTDVTFVERPPLGSILNATVIPASGGDTLWTNQVAAYDALSPALRDFLDGLHAVHDGSAQFAALLAAREGDVDWDGSVYDELRPVVHPVVRVHPETGERALFVNAGFTSHIVELTRAESDALLAYLYAHSTQHAFSVRYHWTAGDVAFWDNRATQHAVVGDFGEQHRVIQRVTLRGDIPVGVG